LYFFVGAFTVALALMLFLKYRTRHGIARVAEARG
jgi:OFA family oxalate/formate antiporter-like MFS transporter